MDLIIKARNVTVTLTVHGFLKVVSANEGGDKILYFRRG